MDTDKAVADLERCYGWLLESELTEVGDRWQARISTRTVRTGQRRGRYHACGCGSGTRETPEEAGERVFQQRADLTRRRSAAEVAEGWRKAERKVKRRLWGRR